MALSLASCEGCLKRPPVDRVDELAYPVCTGGQRPEDLPDGEVMLAGHLRAGPTHREAGLVERYELRRRDCHYVLTVRQEWAQQLADVEVVYDLEWKPLRVWKRLTMPGSTESDGEADIRLYELRNTPATMTRRSSEGLEHYSFRGGRPVAVLGPGRGLVSAWILAHELEVGDVVRGPVLDFRGMVEKVEEVALRRDADRDVPELGGMVRVYTVYGRESVFTDDDGRVIGDLAGLRLSETLDTPEPAPRRVYGEPDPVHTP